MSCASSPRSPDGHADPTPAIYTWTVVEPDTQAPETTIDSGADATRPTTPTRPSRFGAEPGARYECSLDGGAFISCASPIGYNGLAAGAAHLRGARDRRLDNTDQHARPSTPGPSTCRRRRRRSPDSRPTRASGEFVSFVLAGSDNLTAAGSLGYQCRLDDAPWVGCADPKAYAERRLPGRTPSRCARSTPPATSTRPRLRTPGASTTPRRRRRSLRAAEHDHAPPAPSSASPPSRACSTSARSTAAPSRPCTSPASYTGLAVRRPHVRGPGTDAAGNTDPTPATYAWTVDLPPDTTIDDGPAATTARTTRPSGSPPASPARPSSARSTRRRSAPAPRRASTRTWRPATHELRVRAKDSAGNVDPTPASHTWTITAPPETTIDSVEPDMGVDLQTESTQRDLRVLRRPGRRRRFECALDGAAFADCTSPVTYNGLAPGAARLRGPGQRSPPATSTRRRPTTAGRSAT